MVAKSWALETCMMDASCGPSLVIYYTLLFTSYFHFLYHKFWLRCRDFFSFFIIANSMSHKVFSKNMQHLMWVSASFTWLLILKAKSISHSFKCTLVQISQHAARHCTALQSRKMSTETPLFWSAATELNTQQHTKQGRLSWRRTLW